MSTDNICLYKEVARKYTCCNLKTTELLDCVLIGVCAVIRSNTVYFMEKEKYKFFENKTKVISIWSYAVFFLYLMNGREKES